VSPILPDDSVPDRPAVPAHITRGRAGGGGYRYPGRMYILARPHTSTTTPHQYLWAVLRPGGQYRALPHFYLSLPKVVHSSIALLAATGRRRPQQISRSCWHGAENAEAAGPVLGIRTHTHCGDEWWARLWRGRLKDRIKVGYVGHRARLRSAHGRGVPSSPR